VTRVDRRRRAEPEGDLGNSSQGLANRLREPRIAKLATSDRASTTVCRAHSKTPCGLVGGRKHVRELGLFAALFFFLDQGHRKRDF
jgi:hypothetical protein